MGNFSCYYCQRIVHTYLPSLPHTHKFHHHIPQNISQTKLQKKRTPNFDRSNSVQMKNKSLFAEYEIKEKLGESAYSCVYKVQQKTTGFIRAVKTIKCKHIDTTAFGNEIKILKTVDHPNII